MRDGSRFYCFKQGRSVVISIANNMSAYNVQRQMNLITSGRSKSTEKLSSGYKINRAADDAASLTISEKMRSLIRGLNQGADNIQDGISLTTIADGALGEVHSMLHREEELLIKAANGTNTDEDRQAIQAELDQLSAEMDRVFDTTEFNTLKVFKWRREIVGDVNHTSYDDPQIKVNIGKKTEKKEEIWLDKGATPPEKKEDVDEIDDTITSVTHKITDNFLRVDDDGSAYFDYTDDEITTKTHVYSKTTTTVEYQKQSIDTGYAQPATPNVSSTGYMNFRTKGGIALSCAMSLVGIQIDDDYTIKDLCSSSSVKKTNTSITDGAGTVIGTTTKYTINLPNAGGDPKTVDIIQNVKVSGDTYTIDYAVNNNDDKNHKIELMYALDTLNTYGVTEPTNKTKSNTGDASGYTITSDKVKTTINSSGAKASVLNDIGNLQNWVDPENVTTRYGNGANLAGHTGLGTWYAIDAAANSTGNVLGSVDYKVEYIKDPYLKVTTVEVSDDSVNTVDRHHEIDKYQYKTGSVNIQCSNIVDDNINIKMYYLSGETLGISTKGSISAFDFGNSMDNLTRAGAKISEIRSYYGAMTNKLEHAYNQNNNTSENTQAAESRLRDTDMAAEMVNQAKFNVLTQVGTSMMVQCNQNAQNVLQLLQ